MNSRLFFVLPLALLLLGCSSKPGNAEDGVTPAAQISNSATGQTAVFAGGCFWGVDAVFRHVRGVTEVESGYAGGSAKTAHYKLVSSGTTGHAESVLVRFDPKQVSYQQLLEVFLKVAHNPTTRNRQGPDAGPQYRSVIFYTSDQQREAAQAYIRKLTAERGFASPIVTEVMQLPAFYPAEAYHQDFYARHRYMGYIVVNDVPKIKRLQALFPGLYRE